MTVRILFHQLVFSTNALAFLCVFNLRYQITKWKKPLQCTFLHTLTAYFATLMNLKNVVIGFSIT